MKFKLIIEQDENGIFVAECPLISGCISQGKTKDEALKNINNAIKGFMLCYKTYTKVFPPQEDKDLKKLPDLSSEKLIDILKRIGYEIETKAGDHTFLRERSFPHRMISIPEYKNISKGVLRLIIKNSGLQVEDFKDFLKKSYQL